MANLIKGNNIHPYTYFSPLYKFLLVLIVFLFTSAKLTARNTKIDSLNNLIAKEKTDTGKINLTIKKILLISRNDLNEGIKLAKEQLNIADKINYRQGIIKLRASLVNNYIFTGDFKSAKENIHFLENFLSTKDSVHISEVYSMYGMMYGVQAMYDTSILYYEKAIKINERLSNEVDLPTNYANIAIGYMQLANYPLALEYQQKALTLSQKKGDQELEAKTLLNMGITFVNIGDTAKGIQYYLKARDIAIRTHSIHIELYANSNLVVLYIAKKQWDEAYTLAMKGSELAAQTGDIGMRATSLSQAVIALARQNKFEEAYRLSNLSLKIADSSNQPLNIAQANSGRAITLFLQKRYKEAIPYFIKTIQKINNSSTHDFNFVESYRFLSKSYENTGDYKKALENYTISVTLSDSMKKKENIRKATELSMNYDFQKKQDVAKAEQKLKDKIAQSKQLILLVGLGIFILLAIAAFAGFKNKQKANALLKKQKEEIESTLGKLKSAQAQLIQSEKMASLGELTAGIAHEIQNPLNFVNNFSEINKEMIDELQADLNEGNTKEAIEISNAIKENSEKINHHGKRAEAIVKGMLQHSRISTGQKEPVNLNVLCNEYMRLSFLGIKTKNKSFNADLKTDFDESFGKLMIVQQDLGRVLLNLFNNAFYAVGEKKKQLAKNGETLFQPAVTVSTRKSGDIVTITVSDNGNGMPPKILDKIFQPFFTTKSPGQGTGLGLSLSYDIIKAQGGEIKVESKEGDGTKFIIELPIR